MAEIDQKWWTKKHLPIHTAYGIQEGFSDDPEWHEATFPWGAIEECHGGHIVFGLGIGKQVHCPVCDPSWNPDKCWRNIWNQPSESCPKEHETIRNK